MNDPMLMAELAQTRKQLAKVSADREMYIRITAVLAHNLSVGRPVPLLDGVPAILAEDFQAVPKLWSVTVEPAQVDVAVEPPPPPAGPRLVTDGEAPPTEPPAEAPKTVRKDILLVRVLPKLESPRLVVPTGVPSALPRP